MRKKVQAKLPKLVVAKNGDWYVTMSIRNPLSDKLCPHKVAKGFSECETDQERKKVANKIIAEYTKKLQKGWTPWTDDKKVYTDQIVYANVANRFGRKRKIKKDVRYTASMFLEWKEKSLKKKTYSSYQSKMRILVQWLEANEYADLDITEISNKIILQFFEYLYRERDLDGVTLRTYKVKITAYFNFLKDREFVLMNPVFDIPTYKKKVDAAPRQIFRNDLELLLRTVMSDDPQLYLACMMQFYCAIRPGTELRLLLIKDIDFAGRSIRINQQNSKTNLSECITMPKQLQELMVDRYHVDNYNRDMYLFSKNGMPGDVPLGINSMRNRFNKVRDMLGLSQDYKYYSLKHTGASMLLDAGFTIVEVINHLRHHEIQSTYHYIRSRKGISSTRIREEFPDPFTYRKP